MKVFEWTFKGRRAWFVALLFAMCLTSALAAVAVGAEERGKGESAAAARDMDKRFTTPPEDVVLPDIPADITSDPVGALSTAVGAHSEWLGYPDPDPSAIEDAGLSDEFAGRMAMLMQAVLDCPAPELTPGLEDFRNLQVDRLEARTEQQLDCAEATNKAAAGVSQAMKSSSSGDVQTQGASSDVDMWPALFIDADGSNDRHVYDYSVLIDTGGKDTYDNNAGGNLLDPFHGPEGSAAPSNAEAIGCEHPHIVPQVPGTVPAPFDCFADRQTVLIDQSGNDQYGIFEAPRKRNDPTDPLPEPFLRMVDGDCTNDKVVRRIITQGAALEGNALLMDEGGKDQYNGKTGTQGTGHVGGVGVLRDLGQTKDDYLAIRNGQGFSLVSGQGLLQDDGGNDRYHLYMPRPKNLKNPAPQHERGAGGVVDDTDQCDRLPRMVQGAGISFGAPGGMGRLLDEGGEDAYRGNPPVGQLFLPEENPASVFKFRHSSQGFGCDGTIGMLEDRGKDKDSYRGGPRNREDGVSIKDVETDCGTFLPAGLGTFDDDGPKKRRGNGNGNGNGG